MARRILFHVAGGSHRLVQHLLAGRTLRQRMYGTTPIPFLRRLHLIPDEAHFAALASDLPDWWVPERRFDSGFEFELDAIDAAVPDTLPVPDPAVDVPMVEESTIRPLAVTQQSDPAVPAGQSAPREEAIGQTAPARGIPLPRRAFFPPVVRRTVPRTPSVLLTEAAPRSTRSGRRSAVPPNRDIGRATTPAARSLPALPSRDVPSLSSPSDATRPLHTDRVLPELDRQSIVSAPVPVEQPASVVPVDVTGESVSAPLAEPAARLFTPLATDAREQMGQPAIPSESSDGPSVVAAHLKDVGVPDVDVGMPTQAASADVGDMHRVVEEPPAPLGKTIRRAQVQELPSERPQAGNTSAHESSTAASKSGRAGQRSGPARAPEPPPEREGDRLFQPVDDGVDRSPAVWAARLARAMRYSAGQTPATPARVFAADASTVAGGPNRPRVHGRPRPSSAASASAPVSRPVVSEVQVPDRSRRFLKPIVGIDPTTVTVLQGSIPDEINAASRTDALTIGDDMIVVGADFAGERPSDLGLLAHELTHVARQRRPRFVPPAARSVRESAAEPSEETVARRVEARVTGLAHDGAAQRILAERVLQEPAEATLTEEPQVSPAVRPVLDWGGLPAPWEPLPEWLTEPAAAAESGNDVGRRADVRALPVLETPATTVIPSVGTVQPTVHAAESGRAVDASSDRAAAPSAGEGQPPLSPDIDRLARQVYAALKRRFEADARRERMFRG